MAIAFVMILICGFGGYSSVKGRAPRLSPSQRRAAREHYRKLGR